MAERLRRCQLSALALSLLALVGGLTLTGCGNTLQDKTVSDNELETLLEEQHYPVYWLGSSFHGLQLTAVTSDPSGAYTLQYGNCFVGGQQACLTPLEVISSPENSFLPGSGSHGTSTTTIRGAKGLIAQRGEVVELATGAGDVDIRSRHSTLALAAANEMVPLNETGEPGATLPKTIANPEDSKPLSIQEPHPLKLLKPIPSS